MKRYETGELKDQRLQKACAEVEDVFHECERRGLVKSELVDYEDTSSQEWYAMTNVHEFLAELSNPAFVARLERERLWERVVNGVLQIFGIEKPDGAATDAYKRAFAAMDKMLRGFSYDEFNAHLLPEIAKVNPTERIEVENQGKNKKLPAKDRQDLTTYIQSSTDNGAKVRISVNTAIDNLLNLSSAVENLNKPRGYLTDLCRALGNKDNFASNYYTFTTKQGNEVTLRISNHNVNATNSSAGTSMVSIVIKSRRKPSRFFPADNVNVTEYVYFKESLADHPKMLGQITQGIIGLLETGEYKDLTGIAKINKSENVDENSNVNAGINISSNPIAEACNPSKQGRRRRQREVIDSKEMAVQGALNAATSAGYQAQNRRGFWHGSTWSEYFVDNANPLARLIRNLTGVGSMRSARAINDFDNPYMNRECSAAGVMDIVNRLNRVYMPKVMQAKAALAGVCATKYAAKQQKSSILIEIFYPFPIRPTMLKKPKILHNEISSSRNLT